MLPKGPRGRVAALSLALYGGLLGAALSRAVSTQAASAPLRVVSVTLETFDAPSAATPTSSAPAAIPMAQPLVPSAPDGPNSLAHASDPAIVSFQPLADAVGQGSGQLGGFPGGAIGNQADSSAEGAASALIAPGFDAAYLQNPEPVYPTLSKRFGEEGRVLLRVLVSPEGLADQVELRQSSGHPRLDQAALGTVRRWRFTPARRGDERLAAWVLVPLRFQLEA